MTSATDERGVESGYPHTLRPELHKALDAAGIDYWVAQGLTFWNCPDGRECVAYGYQADGRPTLAVKIVGLTDPAQVIAATLGPCNDSCNCTNGERTDLAAENAKLREQMERLVTLLRVDCDIEASWDGLRRFWSIGLTEDGCLMRDRACRAEAENAKLRERITTQKQTIQAYRDESREWREVAERAQSENAKLRELVRYAYECAIHSDHATCDDCRRMNSRCILADRMRELGIEEDK